MDRIKRLCSYLCRCSSFADIGCDHGYCTLYMLKNGLCDSAVISDISEKCLSKAQNLLKDYIKSGKCTSVCCYGLDGTDIGTEQILIAGMGGEEIVSIFERSFIPRKFVLQPMHNARLVREYLLGMGAAIDTDDVFEVKGKFYPVLCGRREGGACAYSKAELAFGKGDINGDFGKFLRVGLAKREEYLSRGINCDSRARITEEAELIKEVLHIENG